MMINDNHYGGDQGGVQGGPGGKKSKLHGTKVHGARARAFDVFCSQMS